MACQITMTVLFYDLLKPLNKSASIVARENFVAGEET